MRGTNSSDAEARAGIVVRAGRERRVRRVSDGDEVEITDRAGATVEGGRATTTSSGLAITCSEGDACGELVLTAGAGFIQYRAGARTAATAAAIVRYRKLFVDPARGFVRAASAALMTRASICGAPR